MLRIHELTGHGLGRRYHPSQAIRLLMARGANPNLADQHGVTPLHLGMIGETAQSVHSGSRGFAIGENCVLELFLLILIN